MQNFQMGQEGRKNEKLRLIIIHVLFTIFPCDLFFVTSDSDFLNHVDENIPYATVNDIDRVISNLKIQFKK